MGLLMFMVALAVVPSDSSVFGIIHWPINALVDFLDARFHFLPDDADTDWGYMRYWLTTLLCYWIFLGITAALGLWCICGRRRISLAKVAPVFLIVAWVFIAVVLVWALYTIHSYGGHWGILQDLSTAVIMSALVLIGFWLVRTVLARRAIV